MYGACIYDDLSPCEDCGRCKTRQELFDEAVANGEIDEDYYDEDYCDEDCN